VGVTYGRVVDCRNFFVYLFPQSLTLLWDEWSVRRLGRNGWTRSRRTKRVLVNIQMEPHRVEEAISQSWHIKHSKDPAFFRLVIERDALQFPGFVLVRAHSLVDKLLVVRVDGGHEVVLFLCHYDVEGRDVAGIGLVHLAPPQYAIVPFQVRLQKR
jgi:hypothetical protein